MLAIFKMSLKGFRAKKLRTALSVLGIAVSAASVMMISSLGSIGGQAVNSELDSMGLRGISVSSDKLLGDDELEVAKSVFGVSAVTPVSGGYGAVAAENTVADPERAYVWGINENADAVISAKTVHGRAIGRADTQCRNNVCVIDKTLSKALFKTDNSIGQYINVSLDKGYLNCEIVGICEAESGVLKSVSGTLAPYFVYLPYTCVAENGFDWIAVRSDSSDTETVCKNIETAFEIRQTDVTVENMSSQRETLSRMMSIVTLVLTLIAAVSLVVSGLSIMTVMLSSVSERTAEIGIKKAIGASTGFILLEFIFEALTISLVGGIIGSAFGAGISLAAGKLLLGSASVDFGAVVLCAVCSAAAGAIFGAYPAGIAARLKPVDALSRD